MKQASMRKGHRWLGVILALFVFLQVGSGLWLTVSEMGPSHGHGSEGDRHEAAAAGTHAEAERETPHGHGIAGALHHAENTGAATYRVALALGILVQTLLGLGIFFSIMKRRAGSS